MASIPRTASRSIRAARQASSSSTSVEPLAFPHAALASGSGGTTKLTIRAFERIPSSAHALALVRAAEARVGPIINVEVPKDPGNYLPGPFIHITVLRPYSVPAESTLHEIPSPTLSHNLSYPGGPSLADLSAPKADVAPSSKTLKYRIEARTHVGKPWRVKSYQKALNPAEEGEDRRIVELLKGFEGFSGGLKGIGRDFEPFVRPRKVRVESALPAAAEGATLERAESDSVVGKVQDLAESVVEPVKEAGIELAKSVSLPTPSSSSSSSSSTPPPSPSRKAKAAPKPKPVEPIVPKLSRKEKLLAQARESAKANALLLAEQPQSPLQTQTQTQTQTQAADPLQSEAEAVEAIESSAVAPATAPGQGQDKDKERPTGFLSKWMS